MSLPIQAKALLYKMHQFQKDNKITKQCITNVQYFYDCIKASGFNVRAKAVIAFRMNNMDVYTVIHMVIDFNNQFIIDPSYEISSDNSYHYFDTIKGIIDFTTTNDILFEKKCITDIVNKFLKFKKFEDQINTGELVICDRDFYHNQHLACASLKTEKVEQYAFLI